MGTPLTESSDRFLLSDSYCTKTKRKKTQNDELKSVARLDSFMPQTGTTDYILTETVQLAFIFWPFCFIWESEQQFLVFFRDLSWMFVSRMSSNEYTDAEVMSRARLCR